MLSRFVVVAAVVAFAGPAWAGPKRDISTDAGPCHVLRLTYPSTAIARYIEAQKDRLEEPDPAVLQHLASTVHVSVVLGTTDMRYITACAEAGAPQKIIVVQDEKPLLTIPLVSSEREVKNLLGMTAKVFEGSAEIAVADVRRLLGSDMGFGMRIVYAGYVHKGHWDNDWAEKLLK